MSINCPKQTNNMQIIVLTKKQMTQTIRKIFLKPSFKKTLLAFLFSICTPILALAQTWQMNLQDAEVKAFVNEVSHITGKDFVLDPRVNGKVTVISHRPLNKEEVYELFLGVLDVNGIIAVPSSGNTVKLVPDNIAKTKGTTVDLRGDIVGETLITRVIPLKNTPVTEMLKVVRPLIPQFAHINAVSSINAIVLSDKANNINQLESLIYALDGGVNDDLAIIPLVHTSPESMLEMISSISSIGTSKNKNSRLKIVADVNHDRLIVKGDETSLQYIRNLVQKLDVKPSKKLSGLKVFKLKHASAAHIAQMLRGLLNNESLNSTGAQSTIQASNALSSTNTKLSQSKRKSVNSFVQSTSTTKKSSRPFSIIADETQNAIVVNAPSELMQEIQDAIKALDSRRAQVLIQAAIIEVSGDNVDQLGVQWALGGPNSGVGITNFGNTGSSLTSLAGAAISKNPIAISSAAEKISGALLGIGDVGTNSQGQSRFYGAILQAVQSTASANLLSMPSILTIDNEEANILVGQNVPFITGQTTSTSNTNPFQTIERKDVGINLTVIPHIGDSGTIRLEVSQEVSSVRATASNIKSSDIITNKRLIKTTVLANDQQTIVLGGLMSDDSNKSAAKVPLFGDLPLIGHLFRSKTSSNTKTNLIVFLQPTILNGSQDVARLSNRRYQQLRMLQLELDNGNLKRVPFSVNALDR